MLRLMAGFFCCVWLGTAKARVEKPGEDKSPEFISKLTHQAEFRARYQFDHNITGIKASNSSKPPTSQDAFAHRFKLGTTFKANEKLSTTLTLIHAATWGSNDLNGTSSSGHEPTGDSIGTLNGSSGSENQILVNEAYGVWSISDSMTLKFGRGSLTLGDGNFVSANDWQATPFSFEGFVVSYLTESMDANFFGVRYAEWQRGTFDNIKNPHDSDPESNSFGMSINIKSLPDFFHLVNLHAQQNSLDEVYEISDSTVTSSSAALPASNNLRFGAIVAGELSGLDFHINYEVEQGRARLGSLEGDIKSNMYQVELGYSFPETMNMRLYALYHQDSGDKNGITATDCSADSSCSSDDDIHRERYDGFFYERHRNAGLMDVLLWGNLTYISAGLTMEPMTDLLLGLHYHAFSRTESTDSVQFQGANTGFDGAGNGLYTSLANAEGDDVGAELDLVATQKFEGGFSVTARSGIFMPGEHLKDSATNQEEDYIQVFLEGRMSF